jgi:hypothetical protein
MKKHCVQYQSAYLSCWLGGAIVHMVSAAHEREVQVCQICVTGVKNGIVLLKSSCRAFA